jgi:hypothetical protein
MSFWVALGVQRGDQVPRSWGARNGLGTPMMIGQPAPCVRALIAAVDAALRAPSPSHGLSALPRTWLALGVTTVLGTHSIGWARCERARLGT